MYCLSYDRIYIDSKSADEVIAAAAKLMRQMAKPGVLAAIYGQSGGDWTRGKSKYKDPVTGEWVYDRVRGGLWGYAWKAGVEMSQETAHMVARMFRDSYPEIPAFWKQVEAAFTDVLHVDHPNTQRRLGPNGCLLLDRLNIEGRHPLLRMQLPSGRRLHYMDARMEMTKMPWEDREGGEVWRPGLVYANADQVTGKWSIARSHGAKVYQNGVQGIARDVLAEKLIAFEEADLPVIGHVHDEGIVLVLDDPFSPRVDDMIEIMSSPVSWAPGLLLGADGFQDVFYRKG
jgi:DNA polymerase